MEPELSHNEAASRFEIAVDGVPAGFADYHLVDGVAIFDHTVVDPAFGGQGLGSVLVGHALAEARALGWRIMPVCPFVAVYLKRHKEFADIVVPVPDEIAEEAH